MIKRFDEAWGSMQEVEEGKYILYSDYCSEKEDTCKWTLAEEDLDYWSTGCGQEFILDDGTPSENKMKFCCYCGRKLVER